jgi:hypothetical protein
MLVACHGCKQPEIGVAVNAEELSDVRVARVPAAWSGACEARTLVATAKGGRVAKRRMSIV